MIELSGDVGVVLGIGIIVLLRLFSIEKRVAALSRLDAKLDLLLK